MWDTSLVSTLKVVVAQDHLERLIKTPMTGVAELVWNALDADAETVTVDIEENLAGGPETLIVKDDGAGISPERADLSFGRLGGSWKKTSASTEGGRALHGRLGQGRWSAYGVGEIVRWDSVAEAVGGGRVRIAIAGQRNALREFVVSEPSSVGDDEPFGTVVRVENLTENAVKELDGDVGLKLTTVFALYLQQYPVSILWRGDMLNPAALQVRTTEHSVSAEGVTDPVTLTIIEWSVPVERALHLCDENNVALSQVAPGIQAPGFNFTAYLSWKGFKDNLSDVLLGDMAEEPLPGVLAAAKDAMRAHFKERAAQRGRELIKAWREDKTWPYKDEAHSGVAKAERDLFEIVAVAVAPAVESAEPKARALALRLLRETVETSPTNLHQVFQEVLNLPQDQVDEFRALLQRTTLSALISSARAITDRLDFLQGLEEIVFDAVVKKRVKERSQLHRILANETWIFREEYLLTADDHTLTTALRDHLDVLGRDDLAPADTAQEVLDEDGNRVVVDLMLSRVIEQNANQREHIVIELKRPSVHVGMEQFSQIQKYATTVKNDGRFAGTDTRWEFWIVGDEIKEEVKLMASQKNRESGIVVDSANFVVRAVTWGQIIQDARHRLTFVRKSLDYTSTQDSGRAYLERVHGQYLPAPEDDTDASTEVSPGGEASTVEASPDSPN